MERTGAGTRLTQLKAYAKAAYIHFKADLLQTQFSFYKRELTARKKELLGLLQEEKTIAEELLSLTEEFPAIGFEASNHYFYNDRNLIEKILQTTAFSDELLK